MFSSHIIREAMRTLIRNPIRSCLTMLGIVMGVAAFICVVAVGNAGSKRVEEQLRTLGDNMIWVEAGSRSKGGVRVGSRGTKSLIEADTRAIRDEIRGVRSVSSNVDGGVQLIYGNQNWGTNYRGVDYEYFEIRKWELAEGAPFDQAAVDSAAPVCVLGKTVADNLFTNESPLGKVIRVNGVPFSVIGVMRPKGVAPNGRDQDDFMVIPISTAQKRLSGKTWLDDIYMSAVAREDMQQTTKDIVALLRERHHLRPNEDDDFNVRSPEDLLRTQLQASQVFTLLLGGAASLSLLVGGIGIMNIMLVSVSQRTREIGIRIAVGATEQDVQLQFLSEAMALSIIGGILGVAAGVASAITLQQTLDWSMELSTEVMLVAGVVAAAIGILFGYYPARTASKLDPMVILRSD